MAYSHEKPGLTCLAIALILALATGGAAHAAEARNRGMQIAVSDDSEATRLIVEALQKSFPWAQMRAEPNRNTGRKRSTYIAVGPLALRALLAQDVDGLIVSIFSSSLAYRAALDSLPPPRFAAVTAIYAEPSPSVQLRLASMLYKNPVRVAVILSDKTASLEAPLQRAAALSGAILSVENLAGAENVNRVLTRLADCPTILATPDNSVYNAKSIRNILMTAYRRNQSVIGFSAAFVKAGALAASYSEIDDINVQLDEVINDFEATGKLPEPQFPKYFNVLVNDDVARSLNIVVDDAVRKFSRKPPPSRQP
ncbi:hypothetical protein AAKU55_000138 [Oxalobacteraceae bacterium GrIS 1.11]